VRIEDLTEDDLPLAVGRYTLTGVLGSGGMARVFAAEVQGELGFRRTVALKFVLAATGRDAEALAQQLAHEARLGGLLDHPSLCQVFDCGLHDGVPFIAMELVPGMTVDELVRRRGPLPPHLALEIVGQAARAIHAAHTATRYGEPLHLVHRDLKPSNLMVRPDGLVKVMDFGVARAAMPDRPETVSGTLKGTPVYMAPEQVRGDPIDHRCDLFALGSVLWSLLTGRLLFGAASMPAIVYRVSRVDEVLSLEGRLEEAEGYFPGGGELLGKLLRADPGERFSSARALADAIDALLEGMTRRPSLESWQAGAEPLSGDREWLATSDLRGADALHASHQTLDTASVAAPVHPGPAPGTPENVEIPAARSHLIGWMTALVLAVALLGGGARMLAPNSDPAPAPPPAPSATPMRLAPSLVRADVGPDRDALSLPDPAVLASAWPDPHNLVGPPMRWLPADVVPGGTLHMRAFSGADPWALDVHGYLADQLREYTQTSLFRATPEDGTGPRSELAWRVTQDDAGHTLTLELRPDLFWHPPRDDLDRGTLRWKAGEHPVTAHDVVFALDVIKDPNSVAHRGWGPYFSELRSWEAVDDHTLRLEYGTLGYEAFQRLGQVFPLPRFLYTVDQRGQPIDEPAAVVAEHWYGRAMLGCGPYRVTRWREEFALELQRDPRFPMGGNAFDVVRFDLLENFDAAAERLGRGELDFDVLPADVVRTHVLDAPPDSPFRSGQLAEGTVDLDVWFAILLNTERPWFKDPAVRRALAHAFRADGLLQEELAGLGSRITGPIPAHSPYYADDVEPLSFDLHRADDSLAAAGWRDDDGDGVREAVLDGSPIRMDFTLLFTSNRAVYADIAERVQQDMGRVGVRVRTRSVSFPERLERGGSGNFDAMLLGFGGPRELMPHEQWHSSRILDAESNNEARLRDPEIDRIAEALQIEFDRSKRIDLGHAFHRRIADLAPALWFYSPQRTAFWNRRLRGVQRVDRPLSDNPRGGWFAVEE
jgi:eukaryotic-like serine/threonine-protein kinase